MTSTDSTLLATPYSKSALTAMLSECENNDELLNEKKSELDLRIENIRIGGTWGTVQESTNYTRELVAHLTNLQKLDGYRVSRPKKSNHSYSPEEEKTIEDFLQKKTEYTKNITNFSYAIHSFSSLILQPQCPRESVEIIITYPKKNRLERKKNSKRKLPPLQSTKTKTPLTHSQRTTSIFKDSLEKGPIRDN